MYSVVKQNRLHTAHSRLEVQNNSQNALHTLYKAIFAHCLRGVTFVNNNKLRGVWILKIYFS